DGVVEQRAHRAVGRILDLLSGADQRLAVLQLDRDPGEHAHRDLALGPLRLHRVPGERERDPARNLHRPLGHSRHGAPYQTWQTISPPSPASRASRSVISPREVDSTLMPIPANTRGIWCRPT